MAKYEPTNLRAGEINKELTKGDGTEEELNIMHYEDCL
jgi:hypothetical protein